MRLTICDRCESVLKQWESEILMERIIQLDFETDLEKCNGRYKRNMVMQEGNTGQNRRGNRNNNQVKVW